MDDDVYVNVKELIRILNIFKDSQPVYFGRSGTTPEAPRTVLKGQCSYIIRSAQPMSPYCWGTVYGTVGME